MEYIEQYFNSSPLPEEVKAFEERISQDPVFAEDLAFYFLGLHAAKEQLAIEKKEQFRQLYQQYQSNPSQKKGTLLTLWRYAAAAAVIVALVISWYFFIQPASPQQMAENYVSENFNTLGVTMGTKEDNLQKGLHLYNEGNLKEALQQFEKLSNLDSTSFEAKKYAGITSLRLLHYDKALHYFKLLENQPGLYANPGLFLQATTLLKRNLHGDKQTAKRLLEQVVLQDQEGKETAEQWLKKW